MSIVKIMREIKASRTPACSKCKHCIPEDYGDVYLCARQEYLEHAERIDCRRWANARATLVRGTRWCRFEPIEEEG